MVPEAIKFLLVSSYWYYIAVYKKNRSSESEPTPRSVSPMEKNWRGKFRQTIYRSGVKTDKRVPVTDTGSSETPSAAISNAQVFRKKSASLRSHDKKEDGVDGSMA